MAVKIVHVELAQRGCPRCCHPFLRRMDCKGSYMNVTPRRQDLGAELLGRARRDQDVREALVDRPPADQWEVVRCVDTENSGWLEGIVDEHGWPGIGLAGEDGAHAAWLLVQHAPVRLRQRCLPLLRHAAETGDAAIVDLAYPDDRVPAAQ